MRKRSKTVAPSSFDRESLTRNIPSSTGEVVIVACDQNDRGIFIARGNDSESIDVKECSSEEEAIATLQNLLKSKEDVLFAQDCMLKGSPFVVGARVAPMTRLEASYHNFEQFIENDDCLILSMGQQTSLAGRVVKKRVISQSLCYPELTLRGIWQEFVNGNSSLREAVQIYLRGNPPEAEEEIFQGFLAALSGKAVQKPIPFFPPIKLTSAIQNLKRQLTELDPKHDTKSCILTDWASFGSLPELLEQEGYTVYSSLESSFQDAARGLTLWGLRQQHRTGSTKAAESSKETPSSALLLQEGKDSLSRGEYDKAIKCFENLLQGDESNRPVLVLWLLANIKQYKSIQGYSKKIDEIRAQGQFEENEKPWLKEIMTIATTEYLEKGDIETAEDHIELAYQIEGSADVASLRGRIKAAKGDQALRKGDLTKAFGFYDEAANSDPHNQTYSSYRRDVGTVITQQRVKHQKLVWSLLTVTVIGVILGIRLWRQGSPVSDGSGRAISSFQTEIKELRGANEKLQRNLNTQKHELASQLYDNDREIKKLKDLLQRTGQGNQQDQKEELEQLRKAVTEAQRARGETEKDLAKARETIASLEERLRTGDKTSKTQLPPGRYEVIRQANLRTEANENARIIRRLNPGTKVRVVEVVGDQWLRIISVYGNPPGYIRRDDAVLLYPESGAP